MADEEIGQEATQQTEQVEQTAPAATPTPSGDNEAVETIKQQLQIAQNKILEQGNQIKEIDRIKKAITGEDITAGMSQKDKERFMQDFVDNPEETLRKVAKNANDGELAEIKNALNQQAIERANNTTISQMAQADPDFNDVRNNMAKYIKPEEFEEYKNRSDGFETLYLKTKGRMLIDKRNQQEQTREATNTVKNISNQTSITEIPMGGTRTQEPPTDDLDKEIKDKINRGEWNSGDRLTDTDDLIFEQFARDAYGFKRK
jgi:hypothetical protein